MAEVPFRPVRQLSEYKGRGASASREIILLQTTSICAWGLQFIQRTLPYVFSCSFVPSRVCVMATHPSRIARDPHMKNVEINGKKLWVAL